MPSWLVGTWSTLSARIRWLVLVATLPAVLLAVYQARSHRMDAIAAVLLAQRSMEREVLTVAQAFSTKLAETAAWAPDSAEKFREAAALAWVDAVFRQQAEAKGWIERDLAQLRPTERGFDFLSDLQELFLPDEGS